MQLYKDPFEYLLVDNFASNFDEIKELAQKEKEQWKPNQGSGKYVRWLEEDIIPQSHHYFHHLTKDREYGKLKKALHWTICPPNWTFIVHVDAIWRMHTMVLYVEGDCGTLLYKNDSKYRQENQYNKPDLESEYEVEVPWKDNRLFCHNPGDKKWHNYKNKTDGLRVVIQAFLMDPDLIPPDRPENNFLLDI